jgi:hypothetical protein
MCNADCASCLEKECEERIELEIEDRTIHLRDVKIDSALIDEEYQKALEQTKKALLLIKELEDRRLDMHEFVKNSIVK